jgi:CubicO group peptidase (beta-lactamase class C family)
MARVTAALWAAAALSVWAGAADAQIPRPHAPPQYAPAKAPPWTLPSDAHIRAVLADLVDRRHVAPGMVIGVIGPGGRRVIAYGRMGPDDPRPVTGETLFEMGSITKLFTALAFTDMARRGEVGLEDPANRYLPAGLTLPERDGRQITLLDLATHTSGLPDFPGNLASGSELNPLAGYDAARLKSFLARYALPRDPGAAWVYSSLGMGLLGDLLARREETGYAVLVKARVLNPLGMTSTGVILTPAQARRLSPGHNEAFARAPNWDDLEVLSGAAGIKSDADDMLRFLAAELGYVRTPLAGPMATMLSVRRRTDWGPQAQAIGWLVSQTSMGEIVHHEGETAGYRTYVAFDPVRRTGIVILANAHTPVDLGDVGDMILVGTRRS